MKSDINAVARKILMPGSDDPTAWENVLTVDPGLSGTGLAFWPEMERGVAARPKWTRVITQPRQTYKSWQEKVYMISSHVATLAIYAELVFIEVPRLWSGDATSRAAATRGDLTKLSTLAGGIVHAVYFKRWPLASVVTAFPSDWKGQLPKRVVLDRIEAALGRRYRDHEADAVGMGLAIQGVL